MSEFVRFPHTPHLAWLGAGSPRDDKVLSATEVHELLAHDLVVEEKVDGANLGWSIDDRGVLRAQNRGGYLDLAEARPQWRPLRRWLAPRAAHLEAALYPDLVLFGEWCFAVHGVRYSRLPDWFLVFDVYDRAAERFWSVERRDALARDLELSVVPTLGTGRFELDDLLGLLGVSALGDEPAEGLYVRADAGDRLIARAKLVRPSFVQSMGDHWTRRPLESNALAPAPHPSACP